MILKYMTIVKLFLNEYNLKKVFYLKKQFSRKKGLNSLEIV